MPRKNQKQDRWPELCEMVCESDGLLTRQAGSWTEQKVHFWSRYLNIVTDSMSGNPKWPEGVAYVDLFAGPGICEISDSSRRFPGAVLVAANQSKPFVKIVACEIDENCADALESRLSKSAVADRCQVVRGDCNERIEHICQSLPPRALTLAFVDPESLHARFETIRKLTANRSVDLLILFADSYDVVRNVERYYEKQTNSKLDAFLGCDWRPRWSNLPNRNRDNTRKLFADIYKEQLATELGYSHFGSETMKLGKTPLYQIIFASRNPLGLKFWDAATARDISRQKRMF